MGEADHFGRTGERAGLAHAAGSEAGAATAELALRLAEAAAGLAGGQARLAAHLRPALRELLRERLMRGGAATLADTGALVQRHWLQLARGDEADPGDAHAGSHAALNPHPAGEAMVRTLYPLYVEHAAAVMQELTRELAARCTPAAECGLTLQALEALALLDPRLARIVRLRWFAGLGFAQIAGVLGENELEVQRAWHKARAFVAAAAPQPPAVAAAPKRRRSRAKRERSA